MLHVHELRLVFRRDFRHRDGADPDVCRPGAATGGGSVRHLVRAGALSTNWPKRRATCPISTPRARRSSRNMCKRRGSVGRTSPRIMRSGSLFEPVSESTSPFDYQITRRDAQAFEAGWVKLVVGHGDLVSKVTREAADFAFAAIHLGDHKRSRGRCPVSRRGDLSPDRRRIGGGVQPGRHSPDFAADRKALRRIALFDRLVVSRLAARGAQAADAHARGRDDGTCTIKSTSTICR